MSRHLANSGLYDEGLIDHRNERPLAVAFATILTVWTLAFGLVSVSGQLHAQSAQFCGRLCGGNLDNGQIEAGRLFQRPLAALASPRAFA